MSDPIVHIALNKLERSGHGAHCTRCLQGLPPTHGEMDPSRVAIGFYALGGLDILGSIRTVTSEAERSGWTEWIWDQQSSGMYGTGFKGSTYMTGSSDVRPLQLAEDYSEFDTPNLIMTYTAILSLAILRDDLSHLERPGLIKFLKSCQREDGSFSAFPNGGEADLRPLYCAFVISSILDDWSGIDIDRAVAFVKRCESYEGGYGQTPYGEALGGTTYCALASLCLLARRSSANSLLPYLSEKHRDRTVRWLIELQQPAGGFSGRTNKIADSCYCFWCGASLAMLGHATLVDVPALAFFLDQCQFKFGGLAKVPKNLPDPYHTYMSLAAISIYAPPQEILPLKEENEQDAVSWKLQPIDILWNTTEATAEWIRKCIVHRE